MIPWTFSSTGVQHFDRLQYTTDFLCENDPVLGHEDAWRWQKGAQDRCTLIFWEWMPCVILYKQEAKQITKTPTKPPLTALRRAQPNASQDPQPCRIRGRRPRRRKLLQSYCCVQDRVEGQQGQRGSVSQPAEGVQKETDGELRGGDSPRCGGVAPVLPLGDAEHDRDEVRREYVQGGERVGEQHWPRRPWRTRTCTCTL